MTDALVTLVEGALSTPWGLLALAAVAAADGFSPSSRARASSSPPVSSRRQAIRVWRSSSGPERLARSVADEGHH